MVGKSILIVDDEAPIREMIAVALEMAGYDCLEADNAQQAHAADRRPPARPDTPRLDAAGHTQASNWPAASSVTS